MMRFVLAALIATSILVTTCNAACFTALMEASPDGTEPEGCLDEGVMHNFNTEWRNKRCMDCSCTRKELHCCNAHGRPVKYSKKDCFVKYDKKACTVSVLQKKDPTKECDYYAMVG